MAGNIPDIVIGRLPIYLRALSNLATEGGKANTSSHELGRRLGISSAQIRKDLSHFGEFGKQGTGYNVKYLIDQLLKILHLDRNWDVAVVGAGFLGHAIARYNGFSHRGFCISWIFDNDPDKIGEIVDGLAVQPMSELTETVVRESVQMAILAVPATVAQQITDLLVDAGIKSILNYAPISLIVPDNVHVQYSDPVVQMQRMTYYLDTSEG